MLKKGKMLDRSMGRVLFWLAVVSAVAVYFFAVPRDRWFTTRHNDFELETSGDNIFQSGPNPYIYNPNAAPVRNPNDRNPNNWMSR